MKRMRIVLIGNGSSIHIRRWLAWFNEQGHEVHLISNIDCERIAGVEFHLVKYEHSSNFPGSYTLILRRNMGKVPHLIAEIEPDIVHLHYLSSYLTYKLEFHPFVVSAWGSDVFRTERGTPGYRYARENLFKGDMITTTSETLRELVSKRFNYNKENLISFPWGLDLGSIKKTDMRSARKMLDLDPSHYVFFAPRGINPPYRPEIIIDAFDNLSNKFDNIDLILLRGYSPETRMSKIKRLAKFKGNGRIRLIDKLLNPQEMSLYYSASDFYVGIPTTDQLSACLLEAMVCGSVPIISNLPAYKEAITDNENGFILKETTVKNLESAMQKGIEYNRQIDDWRDHNTEYVRLEFNWDELAQKMVEIYEDLINLYKL